MSTEPTSTESPARPEGPAPKKMKIWPIALAVVGLTCLSGAGLVGAIIALDKTGKSQPVTTEDRTLLVTTDDLSARVADFEVQPRVEQLTKKKALDGSITLEYEYKPADGALFLNTTVTTERTASTASTNYASLRVGHGLGFSMSADKQTKLEDRNDLFSWGDESHHALITHGGKPVGNLFAARKGRHIYSFMLVGVYFDSTETLGDLLLPKLEQLAKLP
jgi:hypothetical protein